MDLSEQVSILSIQNTLEKKNTALGDSVRLLNLLDVSRSRAVLLYAMLV